MPTYASLCTQKKNIETEWKRGKDVKRQTGRRSFASSNEKKKKSPFPPVTRHRHFTQFLYDVGSYHFSFVHVVAVTFKCSHPIGIGYGRKKTTWTMFSSPLPPASSILYFFFQTSLKHENGMRRLRRTKLYVLPNILFSSRRAAKLPLFFSVTYLYARVKSVYDVDKWRNGNCIPLCEETVFIRSTPSLFIHYRVKFIFTMYDAYLVFY